MKIEKIEKIIGEIEVLTIQSFNEKYPSWISNSLTTVELTLKKTLKEIHIFHFDRSLNRFHHKLI